MEEGSEGRGRETDRGGGGGERYENRKHKKQRLDKAMDDEKKNAPP